jgi:hypothetical protein
MANDYIPPPPSGGSRVGDLRARLSSFVAAATPAAAAPAASPAAAAASAAVQNIDEDAATGPSYSFSATGTLGRGVRSFASSFLGGEATDSPHFSTPLMDDRKMAAAPSPGSPKSVHVAFRRGDIEDKHLSDAQFSKLKDQLEYGEEGNEAHKTYLKMSALGISSPGRRGTVLQQCGAANIYACTLRQFEEWEDLCFGRIGAWGRVCLSPSCTVASHQKGPRFQPQVGAYYLENNQGQLIWSRSSRQTRSEPRPCSSTLKGIGCIRRDGFR